MNAERIVLLTEAILTQDFGANVIVPEKLYALISPAIKLMQNKLVESNPAKLENFRRVFTVQTTAGIAHLASKANDGLRLDMMNRANIRIDNPADALISTVQMVESFERFNSGSIQDNFCILGYLDGTDLRIRDGGNESPTTSFNKILKIGAIAVPKTVTDLADELEGELVEAMVILAKQEIPARRKNVDVAEQKS